MPKPANSGADPDEPACGSAFARIGLLGNPSDAYRGKAIALSLYEFCATVRLAPSGDAPGSFAVPEGRGRDLLRATCTRYARSAGLPVDHASWRVAFESDIPFQVGLAGSSALVIACLRALGTAFARPLDPFTLSEVALAVEVEDLGIAAGPMDRAIQAYEGALHMDFSAGRAPESYTALDRAVLPPLVVAWNPHGGQASGRVHSDVRERWGRGEPRVVEAMREFGGLVDSGMEALRRRDPAAFRRAVDRNFDARCELFPVDACDREMVALARAHGAAAKLCGSGGAVVAVSTDEARAATLARHFTDAGYSSCVPCIPQRTRAGGASR